MSVEGRQAGLAKARVQAGLSTARRLTASADTSADTAWGVGHPSELPVLANQDTRGSVTSEFQGNSEGLFSPCTGRAGCLHSGAGAGVCRDGNQY